MKRPTQHFDLVEIVWDDAHDLPQGWERKVSRLEPFHILSCGFVVKSTKKYIVLALDADEEANHNGRSQIPRSLVKAITVLRKKDK